MPSAMTLNDYGALIAAAIVAGTTSEPANAVDAAQQGDVLTRFGVQRPVLNEVTVSFQDMADRSAPIADVDHSKIW